MVRRRAALGSKKIYAAVDCEKMEYPSDDESMMVYEDQLMLEEAEASQTGCRPPSFSVLNYEPPPPEIRRPYRPFSRPHNQHQMPGSPMTPVPNWTPPPLPKTVQRAYAQQQQQQQHANKRPRSLLMPPSTPSSSPASAPIASDQYVDGHLPIDPSNDQATLDRLQQFLLPCERAQQLQNQQRPDGQEVTSKDLSLPMLTPAFQQLSDEGVLKVLDMLRDFFLLDESAQCGDDIFQLFYGRVFNNDLKESAATIDAHTKFLKILIGNVVMQLTCRTSLKYNQRLDLQRSVGQIITCCEHCSEARLAMAHLREVHSPQWTVGMSIFNNMIWTDAEANKSYNDFQKAMHRIFSICYHRRLMHIGTRVYEPLMLNGVYVHYYRFWGGIDELFSDMFNASQTCNDASLFLKVSTSHDKIVKVLSITSHFCFPILRKQRRYHAFRNGLYDISDDIFHEFDDSGSNRVPESAIACCFHDSEFNYYPELSPKGKIPGTERSALFPNSCPEDPLQWRDGTAFPPNTDEELGDSPDHDFMRIPTPLFDKILDHQWCKRPPPNTPEADVFVEETDVGDPNLVKRYFWANLGRMLHELNSKERCQLMMFLKGAAGSGKSTVMNVVNHWYDPEDVATITPEMEKGFGLEAVADKLLCILAEIDRTHKLATSDIKAMIVGDVVLVRRKNKLAQSFVWKVPCLGFGNENPPWKDDRGAMSRRMWLFFFNVKVLNADMKLEENIIAQELANVLLKANRAYLSFVTMLDQFPSMPVSTYWPEYFNKTRREYSEEVNPFESFLSSAYVKFDKDFYVPLTTFRQIFVLYCKNSLGLQVIPRWQESMFREPLIKRKIQITKVIFVFLGWMGVCIILTLVVSRFQIQSRIYPRDRFLPVTDQYLHGLDAVHINPDGNDNGSASANGFNGGPASPAARTAPSTPITSSASNSASSSNNLANSRSGSRPPSIRKLTKMNEFFVAFERIFPKGTLSERTLCLHQHHTRKMPHDCKLIANCFMEDITAFIASLRMEDAPDEENIHNAENLLREASGMMEQERDSANDE
jgi:hypothetical protein